MAYGEKTMEVVVNSSNQEYIARINVVQDYIEAHLDEELSVERLSSIAMFSSFHFQRIYSFMTGESLYVYIKRLRFQKGTFLLKNKMNYKIIDIALELGFSNQASFSKAFKQHCGISPTQYRRSGLKKSINGQTCISELGYTSPISTEIQNILPMHVVYVRNKGAYKGNSSLFMTLFTKLNEWVVVKKLVNENAKWLVISHDMGEISDDRQLRISVCMTVDKDTEVDGDICSLVVEGGTYIVGRFSVKPHEYVNAWNFMYTKWLPNSGYVPDDKVAFELYPPIETDSEEVRIVDLYIPIIPLK